MKGRQDEKERKVNDSMREISRILRNELVVFAGFIEQCRNNTEFADDRVLYSKDLSLVEGWIATLNSEQNIPQLIDAILSPQTDKSFGDYWKKGDWGKLELEALGTFQNSVRNLKGEADASTDLVDE